MDYNSISSDVLRGYIDLMILRVLTSGDSYGYEISKKITELSQNGYTLSHTACAGWAACGSAAPASQGYAMKETTLYSAFARLEKLNYLHSYPGTISGGRERTYYSLTTAGRIYYHQKCVEWELTKELISKFI